MNGYITLSDKLSLGMELAEDLGKQFPYILGSNTVANSRFPHAWPRALAHAETVRRRYGD